MTMNTQTFKQTVLSVAQSLLKANNTVTTLEVKLEGRKQEPLLYWTQQAVSTVMDELAQDGILTYTDNGSYRIYSDPASQPSTPPIAQPLSTSGTTAPRVSNPPATTRISCRKALALMQNNHGHFFTAEFVKQEDGELRTMNCQYLSGQDIDPLGLVKVKEAAKLKAYNKLVKEGKTPKKDYIRSFNVQSLKTLSIAGQTYKIRKS